MVTKKQAPQFEELRTAIDEAVAQQHSHPTPSTGSIADELAKLQQLLDSGGLSPDEYAAAKARLLGE